MPIEVELVHAESGRRVVLARLIEPNGVIATALGEGVSAEEAEDRARQRLKAMADPPLPRAAVSPPPQAQAAPEAPAMPEPLGAPADTPEPLAMAEPMAMAEPPADPEDWSSELANLDLQLKRLGWNREQEATYLLRAFGHGSRARLTNYGDLLAYLKALESFSPGCDPAGCAVPLKRSALLEQSDQLLGQLGWDAHRGRQLLESRFQRSSRQQLSDSQLLEFNMLLEGELLSGPGPVDALSSAAPAG